MFLFFRLGDFYELFFDDAIQASRLLEITLTSRNKDQAGKAIPMCGVPHHSVKNYLARLLRKGYKVALCEQVEDPSKAKGLVKREVTRVLTPGTVIEDDLLSADENNYIASLIEIKDILGLSFLDVSTGEFWLSELRGSDAWEKLIEQLEHFRPSEVILPEEQVDSYLSHLPPELVKSFLVTPQPDWTFHIDYCQKALLTHFHLHSLAGFGIDGETTGISAAGGLLGYVRQTQKVELSHIVKLRIFKTGEFLRLDEATVSNLELVKGLDGNKKWTLLSAINRTRTGMGARKLRSWILRPTLDLKKIYNRLDAVEELTKSFTKLEKLTGILARIYDVERLLSRVTMETAGPRDLLALAASFATLPSLYSMLTNFNSLEINPALDELEDLRDYLYSAISEEAPISVSDGGVIKSGFSTALDDLRGITSSGKSIIAQLESTERKQTGISSLKVKYNRVFGYFIEITKANLDLIPQNYTRKQTLVNCERFITPELKEHEEKILNAEEEILKWEREIFVEVRQKIAASANRIQQTAGFLSKLDVLTSFAEQAMKSHYTRPKLNDSRCIEIRGGRHPVLEQKSETPFVPNNLTCDTDGDQLLILTGPNMGGKSTFLRQNALIVLLAQMGSFVPAESASIGVVDRIYTRVGASDNLALGRSTFMVEMIETANILNTATDRSFVLLDEVGRGTATFDGLSLAWSIVEFLVTHSEQKARTIFATHYQELTKLESKYKEVRNYCVNVRESNGEILFFHRILPGIASKSYGIEVARLAGIPASVLDRAREILTRLEGKRLDISGDQRASKTYSQNDSQKELFETYKEPFG